MVTLSWSRFGRRLAICRFLAVAISISFLCVLLLSPSVTSTETRHGTSTANEKSRFRSQEVTAQHQHGIVGQETLLEGEIDHEQLLHAVPTSSPKAVAKQTDQNLEQAVLNLSTFTEDEIRTNALLAVLPSTGGTHLLRELSLRVRVFKQAFEAWKTVQLSWDGGVWRQQNVIKRLRETNARNLLNTIVTHDSFRSFFMHLAERLFPFLTPFYGDLLSLYSGFAGRGLVFTAGDKQAPYLLTSIPGLRKLGCDLPVEIMYLGDSDLGEDMRGKLEQLPGVVTRDMSLMVDDDGWTLKGWAAKPWAILLSSFQEAIFIDADALFFRNPEMLFEDEDYVSTGTLFFIDRKMFPENKRTWLRNILPKPLSTGIKTNRLWTGESGHMQDSGVIVVDKWRHFVALLLTCRLNGPDRDGDSETGRKGMYDMVYGDKETFWLSWEMAGDVEYAFHDGTIGSMNVMKPTKSSSADDSDTNNATDLTCSPQLLHLDRGRPLWFNGWIAAEKFEGSSNFQTFESYSVEPEGVDEPWDLRVSNVACLKVEESYEFTDAEHEILEELLKSARHHHTLHSLGT
ncbi:putative alpha-1,3-mannosyltransferase MNN1 [Pseudocercospora fuligena]|uniref:Putative alpha-1,3-mannosyltransferase MNN1 n=1 Tax=Pseudocercospora fuligena TaxID=685502 RepID=A0A8H6VHV4_9PEZI|nr:putative alpha-1,3-mannosyltransferase MNN1 [Pseudocercospora fuligena]